MDHRQVRGRRGDERGQAGEEEGEEEEEQEEVICLGNE